MKKRNAVAFVAAVIVASVLVLPIVSTKPGNSNIATNAIQKVL